MRNAIDELPGSKIREVANAGIGRADVLPFWFGESDEVTPAFVREAAIESLRNGETFYAQKEYLSARRDYRAIVDRGTEPRFSPYFGKALGRLVDVCLRIGDLKGLDEVFAKINQVPPSQVSHSSQVPTQTPPWHC